MVRIDGLENDQKLLFIWLLRRCGGAKPNLRERAWILCRQLSRIAAKESERKFGAKISSLGKFLRFCGTTPNSSR